MQLRFRDALDSHSSPLAASQKSVSVEFDAVLSAIERYVEELRIALRGADAVASAETCEEIRLHLRASMLARIELGETPEEAEREALRLFGASRFQVHAIAGQMRRKALCTDRQAAFRYALKTYGSIVMLDVVCATIFCCLTCTTRFHFVVAYWATYCVFWLLSGSALVTGWIVGWQTASLSIRATLAAHLRVISALLLSSGIVAAVIHGDAFGAFHNWPHTPGQTFVDTTFAIAIYHVIRTPLSLVASWTVGRLKRKALPLERS